MTNVEIRIGPYIIRPQGNRPDGRVFVEIRRVEGKDDHDHPVGPVKILDVDWLFETDGQSKFIIQGMG